MKSRNHMNAQIVITSLHKKSESKIHVESVHENKKPCECSIWDYSCSIKDNFIRLICILYTEQPNNLSCIKKS